MSITFSDQITQFHIIGRQYKNINLGISVAYHTTAKAKYCIIIIFICKIYVYNNAL